MKGEKTGGRSKGTKNKNKQKLLDLIREEFPDYHPIVALAKLAHFTEYLTEDGPKQVEQSAQLRFLCHREIAKYVVPRPKAIDSNFDIEDETIPLLSNDELIEGITKLLASGQKNLPDPTSEGG